MGQSAWECCYYGICVNSWFRNTGKYYKVIVVKTYITNLLYIRFLQKLMKYHEWLVFQNSKNSMQIPCCETPGISHFCGYYVCCSYSLHVLRTGRHVVIIHVGGHGQNRKYKHFRSTWCQSRYL